MAMVLLISHHLLGKSLEYLNFMGGLGECICIDILLVLSSREEGKRDKVRLLENIGEAGDADFRS